MPTTLSTPAVADLGGVLSVLREWQYDGAPIQLHPGDLGWQWRFGAAATAGAVRVWERDGVPLAVGFLDGPRLLRTAVAPQARDDDELAARIADDVGDPARGVLPAGAVDLEVRAGPALVRRLQSQGWSDGETWAPLTRDLSSPVEQPELRIEVAGPEQAAVRADVHRASFAGSTFTEPAWQVMADGPAYADARCLIGYDSAGAAVAAVTVWSAGPSRPGLLEPLGVGRDFRGAGHGRSISLAAAAALRELGSSSATVCTPSANIGAVATYVAAGFRQQPDAPDLSRSA